MIGRSKTTFLVLAIALVGLVVAACGGSDPTPIPLERVPTVNPTLRAPTPTTMEATSVPSPTPPESSMDSAKQVFATFETSKGKIKFELLAKEAPVTVNNFVTLARDGYYDGVIFHRVLANFMAQGGDPTGTGTGGPGYTIVDEFYCTNGTTTNAHPADCELATTFDAPGILAMANTGQPGTGGSQFFITFVPTPHLNGLHTIFGRVIEGMDVVNSLQLRDPGTGGPSDQIDRIVIEEIAT